MFLSKLSNALAVQFSACFCLQRIFIKNTEISGFIIHTSLKSTSNKARFIANSSSCTTTELSKLLTSCLTAIKSHVIRYCETVYETSNKKLVLVNKKFW